jgi:HEAT repeat protein
MGAARAGEARPPPVAPLLPLLADADTAIAWRAAYVLARARNAAAVRAMIGATNSPAAQVRDFAARGLARSLSGDSLGTRALDALRRLVVDPDARVRVTAVRVLGAYGALAGSAIATALRDADPAVRVTAASVAHVALDTSASAWEAAWRADTSFLVRRALAEAGAPRGMLRGAWQDWRADSRWQYRAAVATFDGLGAADAALVRLDSSQRDADGRVRAAATEALAALADSASVASATRGRLRAALADTDFVVRATALGALAKGATTDDLAAAFGAYAIGRRDADLDARLAFWTLADSVIRTKWSDAPRFRRARPRRHSASHRSPRARACGEHSPVRRVARQHREPREDAWYRDRAREALTSRCTRRTNRHRTGYDGIVAVSSRGSRHRAQLRVPGATPLLRWTAVSSRGPELRHSGRRSARRRKRRTGVCHP